MKNLLFFILPILIGCQTHKEMTFTYEEHLYILDLKKVEIADSLNYVYENKMINFVDSIMNFKKDTVYIDTCLINNN